MQFLFLIMDEEGAVRGIEMADVERWFTEIESRGARLIGGHLQPRAEGVAVSVRDGSVLTTDGPFAETKESIGGFDVIECASREDAIALAAAHPVAPFGRIVIREVWNGPLE